MQEFKEFGGQILGIVLRKKVKWALKKTVFSPNAVKGIVRDDSEEEN
jgi:hypothetical protein